MIRVRMTLVAMGAALALIGASAVVRSDPLLVWNASVSVPIGLYAVTPITQPDIGDIVAVRPPEPLGRWLVANGYLGTDTPLLKRVAALPGSEVCRHGTTITIDGHAAAEAQLRDRLGRPLPAWRGCRTLRVGELFLLNADHVGSLDGRYFGPLGADTIIGRATPIWTRQGRAMRTLPPCGRRLIVAPATGLAVAALLLAAASTALAEPSDRTAADQRIAVRATALDDFIAEASARFAIPERWIRAVMQAESAGDPRAVSRAGAMGLMQIMPATWAELRARHGLGADVFDPRDNILAGAAYLREMYNRFGSPGFLAAYNAGPARYAEHLATGRPLPRETRAYMATLAPLIGGSSTAPLQAEAPVLTADWRAAPLFVARLDPRSGSGSGVDEPAAERPSHRAPTADAQASNTTQNGLFVRSSAEGSR